MPERPSLTIPPDAWNEYGEVAPRDYLITTISINGLPMHLEAWRVRRSKNDDPPQTPVGVDEEHLTALYQAVGADGPMQTTRIGRWEYILVASPFCE